MIWSTGMSLGAMHEPPGSQAASTDASAHSHGYVMTTLPPSPESLMSERDDASKLTKNQLHSAHTYHLRAIMSVTAHSLDPVDVSPLPPLQDSYVYHSAPFESPEGEGWIMGIDEAGRGRESVPVI